MNLKKVKNRIFNILQLRLHPSIVSLKKSLITQTNNVELKSILFLGDHGTLLPGKET